MLGLSSWLSFILWLVPVVAVILLMRRVLATTNWSDEDGDPHPHRHHRNFRTSDTDKNSAGKSPHGGCSAGTQT